jgi:hypothetical protein
MRPTSAEFAPYYAGYIALVPDDQMDIAHTLADQHHDTVAVLRRAKSKADYSYAPGKWTVKQVVGHICDTERIMATRALRFARGDSTDLPGFDQNTYAATGQFDRRTIDDLLEELWAVRAATLSLAKHLPPESLTLTGTANGNAVSVRGLLYIIAGHELHHVGILKEKYGV